MEKKTKDQYFLSICRDLLNTSKLNSTASPKDKEMGAYLEQ